MPRTRVAHLGAFGIADCRTSSAQGTEGEGRAAVDLGGSSGCWTVADGTLVTHTIPSQEKLYSVTMERSQIIDRLHVLDVSTIINSSVSVRMGDSRLVWLRTSLPISSDCVKSWTSCVHKPPHSRPFSPMYELLGCLKDLPLASSSN